jgi:VIT1/CCC1 family predicted Fe2+/Mn2+ transporter
MAHDALGAHARDELGITDLSTARPLQAAAASAASFTCGALLPLFVTAFVSVQGALIAVPATALVFLALLGAIAARAGGAPIFAAAARVTFWGAIAMAATAGIGELFGTIVG